MHIILAVWIAASTAFAADTSVKPALTTAAEEETVEVKRRFVDGPYGQIHLRIAENAEAEKPPLVLFHPTPYSSDYYKDFITIMAADRPVIAIDTPGYGDSAPPPEPLSLPDYASAIAAALEALGYGNDEGKVDMLGFHTGALIAAELAASRPDLARKIVLPGLPYFTGDAQKKMYEENAQPEVIKEDGGHLDKKWEFAAYAMSAGLSVARAQEHFSDSMQCYPNCWWAYHGVFTYDADAQFKKVKQPVLLITTKGSLSEETRNAKDLFSDATLVHLSSVSKGAFDLAPEEMARATRQFLDDTSGQ